MAPLTHLEVVTAPLVNHAMAHNGIRVVRQITLVSSPDLDGGHTDVVLTARLVDAHSTVLTRPWQHHVDRLDAGGRVRLDNPDITLDPAAIASLDEETGADLIVEATRARPGSPGTDHAPRRRSGRSRSPPPPDNRGS